MSDAASARRTEIIVKIDGADISADINKYLLQLTYTDHEEDKTDDLQISLDDREGVWIADWLPGGDAKGAEISAGILQRNWESDGKDRVLDCGSFEIAGLDASGPPAQASIKATSLPHSSTARTEKKTRAWEKIKLSAIANEIASKNGMESMFLSSFDPVYSRREQVRTSDIVFLQGLCKDAGISLKASAGRIVLFDEADFESKETVRKIKRGAADVLSYRFGASTNDTTYGKCHVAYTDPQTGQTI